jgi:lambda family phage tail tape measure protein
MAVGSLREILIKVTTTGGNELRNVQKEMNTLNKSVDSLKTGVSGLGGVFASLLTLSTASTFSRWADEIQLISDRIKIFTPAGQDANKVFTDMINVANNTKSSLADIGTLYNRIALSTKDLGVSSESAMLVTGALQNTFRLSGSTLAESAAAGIQFGQAMSYGTLRSQELRSVMQADAYLAKELKDHFEKGGVSIFKMAEAGKITVREVLLIFAKLIPQINQDVQNLSQTFEQTLVLAFNKIKIKVNELNVEWGLNSKFQQAVKFILDNFYLINIAISTLVIGAIPRLITSIVALSSTLFATGWGGWFLAIGAAVGLIANFETITKRAKLAWYDLAIAVAESGTNITEVLDKMLNPSRFISDLGKTFAQKKPEIKVKVTPEIDWAALNGQANVSPLRPTGKNAFDINSLFKIPGMEGKQTNWLEQYKKERQALYNEITGGGTTAAGDQLNKVAALQAQAEKIRIQQEETKKKREKAIRPVVTKSDLGDFKQINDALMIGTVALRTYYVALEAVQTNRLELEFIKGKISLEEFDSKLTKVTNTITSGTFRAGIQEYLRSTGTFASNIASMISSVFARLEDVLFDFIKKGEFEFRKFTEAILDDLMRIVIRAAIVQPLAGAVMSAFGTSQTSAAAASSTPSVQYTDTGAYSGVQAAHGQAFYNGILQKFASGGLVSSPTLFGHSKGMGLMGEAGTEAILPLRRGSNGNLGVEANVASQNVIVNVINNSTDVKTETKETRGPDGSKMIDILIISKVQEGIAGGSFDKQFAYTYGLKRRGN